MEQISEQPIPKTDTEGYMDRGTGAFEKTNRPLGRLGSFLRKHPVAQKVVAVGAFVGLGGIAATEVTGCGSDTGKPIITTPNITMVSTTESPNSTVSETTTTIEKPTTTTTEVQFGVDADFISKEKTLADVTGKIEKGEYLKKPIGEISTDLQKLFNTKNPGKILWVGDKNRDGEMNAVITDKLWHFSFEPVNMGQRFDYAGGNPDNYYDGTGKFDFYGGELLDIIPAASSEEPDVKDFYMRLRDPLTQKEIYARICLGDTKVTLLGRDYSIYTRADLFDLQKEDQIDATKGTTTNLDAKNVIKNFLEEHNLSELVQPGDFIRLEFLSTELDSGPFIPVDKKDVQLVGRFFVEKFNENDQLRSLIQ